MTDLPEPLVPPDCNCQGLPFMPMEVMRLRDSDLVALSTGDEFKAAVLLWAASWIQSPASSLPDDDRVLARLAGCSLAEWRIVREMALHGWIKCLDGRLYHPLIADLAASAMAKRRGQSERASSRWAKEKAAKNAAGLPRHMPRDEKPNATASKTDAEAMQGTGTVEGTEPPIVPPRGNEIVVRQADVDAIWTDTPRQGRERSGRKDLERALKAAAKRGHPPDAIRQALRSYYASPEATKDGGQFAKGVHRLVEQDRWQNWADGAAPSPSLFEVPVIVWNGPPEVRAILRSRMDDAEVERFLDTKCTWRDLPDKAIVARSAHIAHHIRGECGRELLAAGVNVIVAEERAA